MKYEITIHSETREDFTRCNDTFIVIAKDEQIAVDKAIRLLHKGIPAKKRNYVIGWDVTIKHIEPQETIQWIVKEYKKFLEFCEKSCFDPNEDNHYKLWLKGTSKELAERL